MVMVQCGNLFGDSAEIAFGYLHIPLAVSMYTLTAIKYLIAFFGYWVVTYMVTGLCIVALFVEFIVIKGVKTEELKESLL